MYVKRFEMSFDIMAISPRRPISLKDAWHRIPTHGTAHPPRTGKTRFLSFVRLFLGFHCSVDLSLLLIVVVGRNFVSDL